MPKAWKFYFLGKSLGVSLVCIETVEDRSLEQKVGKQNLIFLVGQNSAEEYQSINFTFLNLLPAG